MNTHHTSNLIDHGDGDEPLGNHSGNPDFDSILTARLSRRAVLKGGLGASIAALFAPIIPISPVFAGTNTATTSGARASLLGFAPVAANAADQVTVPKGYRVQVLAPWGTPLTGAPMSGTDMPFDPLKASGADQAAQVGSHHDGMHFFPIEGKDPNRGSSTDGLLVMNHEYVEPRFMHASAVGQALTRSAVPLDANGKRAADEVLKELNGHGVSVLRIRSDADGAWKVVADARNRRITGLTPMAIAGPVRGDDKVKTRYSPDGTMTRGTLNNCAHGVTPWNTYLTCEENWASYFVNRGERPREHARYGVGTKTARYAWDQADNGADEFIRFDASAKAASATGDYRNEPNTFGWVVEIDPFNPASVPVKRTHLGRFAHEGVVFHPAVEGKPVVCYSGDDARNEYIYKFVSAKPYHKASASGALLDEGTLYVARFNADGTGEWLPLKWGHGPLVPQPVNQGEVPDCDCFKSQADVLLNTRLAADKLGATKMDRPEWGAIDPKTGMVYFTLTNNTSRKETDAANPRVNSRWGHIIRWREEGTGGANEPAATRFKWDIFLLAGPADDSRFAGKPLAAEQTFNSPDGLWFDQDGRLWIQTDISESVMNSGDYAPFGNNQMLAADPLSGDLRRFLVGPLGQEITGVITTPDQRTMFVNIQHPGATTSPADFAAGKLTGTWPNQGRYPRSATVVITREDGGVIGS